MNSPREAARMRDDQKGFVSIVVAVIILLLVAVVMREMVVQAYMIPAGSMRPTLEIGDRILVSKLAYGIHVPLTKNFLVQFEGPTRGDLVVFIFPEDPSKDFIKRVLGTGGDVVEIKNKKVWLNGQTRVQ